MSGVDGQNHTVYQLDRRHRLLQTIGAPFDRPTNFGQQPAGYIGLQKCRRIQGKKKTALRQAVRFFDYS